jgi:hypothetical protein
LNAIVDECGECDGNGIDEGTCDCDGNLFDCAGECNGDAVIDECGECGGDGIDEGVCDCDNNVLDCNGVCGGDAVLDECDICDNDSSNDCTLGCTDSYASNYDESATDNDGSCIYDDGDLEYRWTQLFDESDMPDFDFTLRNFSYDSENNIIYSVNTGNNVLGAFDLNTLEWREIEASDWPGEFRDFVFDPANNRILAWRSGTDNVYAISALGGSWTQVANGGFDGSHYGSRPYWNPLTESPGFPDGYGNNTMKNSVYEVDFDSGGWELKRENTNSGNPGDSVNGFQYGLDP